MRKESESGLVKAPVSYYFLFSPLRECRVTATPSEMAAAGDFQVDVVIVALMDLNCLLTAVPEVLKKIICLTLLT